MAQSYPADYAAPPLEVAHRLRMFLFLLHLTAALKSSQAACENRLLAVANWPPFAAGPQ